ncbi:MAG: UDP-glucose/GDP-mannose dehydrogenase family protein [Candidatus Woesebacteria bacterium]|jgi:UDPglucose 6-dehydrogenase
MKITIIGTGFVGLVSAAVYASLGHQIIGLDIDQKKVKSLEKSQVPFYEPNLEELLKEQQKKKLLKFTTDYQKAIKDAEIIIIAVGTPSAADGQADLKYLDTSSETLAPYLKKNTIVAVKSTVPPGALKRIEKVIKAKTKTKFYTASLPEFLREGSAVADTLNPDRIIIGATDDFVFNKLEQLHRSFKAPILKMKPESAQMAKYTANSYLATRITFINQIANLCELNGADIEEVIQGIGLDKRVGKHYWYPGFGYGGSCFPKDVKELAAYSRAIGQGNNLLNKVNQLNEDRIPTLLEKFAKIVEGWQDKKISILGLSFKANTDDMREAPATKVIPILLDKGAKVLSYDPMANWSNSYPDIENRQVDSVEKACENTDVIFALIEWPQIISFDFSKVRESKKNQYFIDARNQFDPKIVKNWGFKYFGIGRQ